MSISILRGSNGKPASSQALASAIASCPNATGQLFIGYPIIRASDGPRSIDALLVSPDRGIVVFDLIEGDEPGDYGSRQDDAANMLEARLKMHRGLLRRRDLRIPIHTLSFTSGPFVPPGADDDYPVVTSDSLKTKLDDFRWNDTDRRLYEVALSAIENISNLRAGGRPRAANRPDSRGAKLQQLEASIATMDHEQGRAVVETVEGVQRIRGLAGSGKTVVLALKAAYLHVQHPEWRIAVACHTQSLKGHFRRLIRNFCVELTGEDPDWGRLRITNSWGSLFGNGDDGLYLEFCRVHDIEYLDFLTAEQRFGGGGAAFAGACRRALARFRQSRSLHPRYDAILIDEAQDLPKAFLQICYELLRDPRRLVYAYDELQNLSGPEVLTPETLFGADRDGKSLGRRDAEGSDIVLKNCYRNSRPVLVTAHALGFGIYRQPGEGEDTGLVRMFDDPPLWQDIGYRVRAGDLRDGAEVTLARTPDTSPEFLEGHSGIGDLLQFVGCDSEAEQSEWVATAIRKNLERDELRHDDILVINPNPLMARNGVGPIRARLMDFGISSHFAGVYTSADESEDESADESVDDFHRENFPSVRFTGIHRAKESEVGMVYVINAHACHGTGRNLASIRNGLFVAIMRSKAWVRVVGVGAGMKAIKAEYDSVRDRNFELRFTYPTEEQRGRLRTTYEDMTEGERDRLQKHGQDLDDLINDLVSGRVRREDLGAEKLEALKSLIG